MCIIQKPLRLIRVGEVVCVCMRFSHSKSFYLYTSKNSEIWCIFGGKVGLYHTLMIIAKEIIYFKIHFRILCYNSTKTPGHRSSLCSMSDIRDFLCMEGSSPPSVNSSTLTIALFFLPFTLVWNGVSLSAPVRMFHINLVLLSGMTLSTILPINF